MYVRDVADLEWLTGFENVFDDERAHAAFVPASGEDMALHTDSRYVTAMMREAENSPVSVDADIVTMAKWAREKWDANYAEGREDTSASELEGDSADSSKCASEGALAIEDSMTLFEYRALQGEFDGRAVLKETHDVILKLRAVKDFEEAKRMQAAQDVTDASFSHILGFIKPGVTEREVQLELDGYMLSHGASGLAFPSIIASGPNGASPHAIVSDRRLEAGECVVMDFGAKRAGYCSDMTRTVFLGEPEGEMLAAWETMRRANEEVQGMLRPGVTGKEAHEFAERILDEGGFGGCMGHGLGHGVGLRVHELPVLNSRNVNPLVAGNVVTVEPGIYIPGSFGMRLEDFGIVTEDGFKRFTNSTHDLIVL